MVKLANLLPPSLSRNGFSTSVHNTQREICMDCTEHLLQQGQQIHTTHISVMKDFKLLHYTYIK